MPVSELSRWASEIDRAEALGDLRLLRIETFRHLSGPVKGKVPSHVKAGNKMRQEILDDYERRATQGIIQQSGTPSRKYVPVSQIKDYLRQVHRLAT